MENKQNDKRFEKKRDAVKYYVDMCSSCGLCCWSRDWSTEWLGKRVGICGNLDVKTGKCLDDSKKSLHCRLAVCEDFKQFSDWVRMSMKLNCPTSSRFVQEMMVRKRDHFTDEEIVQIQQIMMGEQ